MSEEYRHEDHLSVNQLKAECRRGWDESIELNQALLDLPEVPSLPVLRAIQHAAMNWHRSQSPLKRDEEGSFRLQRKHGPDSVPYKCEYEKALALWLTIRDALLKTKPE